MRWFALAWLLLFAAAGSAAVLVRPGAGSIHSEPLSAGEESYGAYLATPTPTAGLPTEGTYRGITSQGRAVEFDVVEGGRAIGRIEFDVEGVPSDARQAGSICRVAKETDFQSNPWPIAPKGFSYAPGDFCFSILFDSATTAHGFVHAHTSDLPEVGEPCDSGLVTWTASVEPGGQPTQAPTSTSPSDGGGAGEGGQENGVGDGEVLQATGLGTFFGLAVGLCVVAAFGFVQGARTALGRVVRGSTAWLERVIPQIEKNVWARALALLVQILTFAGIASGLVTGVVALFL